MLVFFVVGVFFVCCFVLFAECVFGFFWLIGGRRCGGVFWWCFLFCGLGVWLGVACGLLLLGLVVGIFVVCFGWLCVDFFGVLLCWLCVLGCVVGVGCLRFGRWLFVGVVFCCGFWVVVVGVWGGGLVVVLACVCVCCGVWWFGGFLVVWFVFVVGLVFAWSSCGLVVVVWFGGGG